MEVCVFILITSGCIAVGHIEVFDLMVQGALLVLILRQRYLLVLTFTYVF